MQFQSIATRLQTLMGAGLLAAVAIVAACSVLYSLQSQKNVSARSTAALQKLSVAIVEQRTLVAGYDMTSGYRKAFANARTMADALMAMQIQARKNSEMGAVMRKAAGDMVHGVLLRNPDLLGVWFVLEPNQFDGNDRPFINRADLVSNEIGRPAPFWARDASGKVSLEVMGEHYYNDTELDATGIPNNFWYACALTRNESCFIEPYNDNVDGENVLMSSVTVPITFNGKAIGASGNDFSVDNLSEITRAANKSLFDGSGRMLLLSHNGLVVADSENQLAGQNIKNSGLTYQDWWQTQLGQNRSEVNFDRDPDNIVAWVPVNMGDGKTVWGVALSLPKSVVFAEVSELNDMLAAQTRKSLITQIIVGAVVFLVAMLFVRSMSKSIIDPVLFVGNKLHEIALGGGDLTQRLPVHGSDEVAKLSTACNELLSSLQNLLVMVKSSSDAVAGSANRTAELALDTAQGISSQQTEIDMVATAATEMSSAINEVAQSANRAASSADGARQQAQAGHRVVDEAVQAIRRVAIDVVQAADVIKKLSEDSERVGSILDSVRGIAEQTNLLALNAAIEAARAGDQGRGFAVVADEVRQLAQRTHTSTQEIQEIIAAIRMGTAKAVEAMEKSRTNTEHSVSQANAAGTALTAITTSVSTISDMNLQIAAAVEEQSKVTEEITRNVTAIRDVSETLAHASHDSAETGNALRGASDRLQQMVKMFKV